MSIRRLLVILAALAAASPVAAQEASSEEAADVYSVKVSLSRSDPDVHAGTADGAGPIDFYIFVDGAPARGAEFGIEIEGGKLVAYIIDPDNPWVALPMTNPYPGTIAQVKGGKDCYDDPVFFGRMMVQPDEPGGRVALNVIPSVRAGQAVILHCDNSGTFGFLGVPAAANGDPAKAGHVANIPQVPATTGSSDGGADGVDQ